MPVVTWLSVRTLLILSVLHDLEEKSIDFTLPFSQVDLNVDVYKELSPGFDTNVSIGTSAIKFNKSLYGLFHSSHN